MPKHTKSGTIQYPYLCMWVSCLLLNGGWNTIVLYRVHSVCSLSKTTLDLVYVCHELLWLSLRSYVSVVMIDLHNILCNITFQTILCQARQIIKVCKMVLDPICHVISDTAKPKFCMFPFFNYFFLIIFFRKFNNLHLIVCEQTSEYQFHQCLRRNVL